MSGAGGNEALIVRDALAKGADFLAGKGVATPRLDAELLLGQVVGLDRLGLYLNFDRPLNGKEREQARELLRRRGLREPVAYILGRKEFHSREFNVDRRVLIPRPETELLVDAVIEELKRRFAGEEEGGFRILELGVGSGAIAVTLAAELPKATVVATEISPGAAEVARANGERHGVSERIDIRLQPDFSGLQPPFHAVVSNPPYVNPADRETLSPDVREYEPSEALFAGEEGLAIYRQLLRETPPLLVAGGFLAVEIGQGQREAIASVAGERGLAVERVVNDYAGIERVLITGLHGS